MLTYRVCNYFLWMLFAISILGCGHGGRFLNKKNTCHPHPVFSWPGFSMVGCFFRHMNSAGSVLLKIGFWVNNIKNNIEIHR